MKTNLLARQVHLDFHTSQLIPDVGLHFDSSQFAQTLIDSNVQSITCFARCHHGMVYYPSKVHADAVHPNINNRDLLGEQVNACHKAGIKAPVYSTIQWDQRISESHPQWCMRTESGQDVVAGWSEPGYLQDGFYTFLCVNSPYRQYIFEEVEELQAQYSVDGFFFDILYVRPCYCFHCATKMEQQNIDMNDVDAVKGFAVDTLVEFKRELSERIRKTNAQTTIFYNTSHVHPGYRRFKESLSHIEVESLPSGGWGYDHFPVVGRYARTLGKPILGMTAKFHTYWGDFHSLKTPEALQYECFLINAFGAGVSVGDQMHPDGSLSKAGYQLIESVFSELKTIEDYSQNVQAVCELAILNPEENPLGIETGIDKALIGATRLLQECGYQFDIIDSQHRFESYTLLVLVDSYKLTTEIAEKVRKFIASGGKVITAGGAPFDANLRENHLPELAVAPQGNVPFSPDYFLAERELVEKTHHALPPEELVMYQGGVKIEAKAEGKVLAQTVSPFFNREGRNYCSHQHTPSSRKVSHPALVQTEQTGYFSNPVFSIYAQKAPRWVREMVKQQCDRLLSTALVVHNGPKSLIITLNHQPEKSRYVLHLLHYIPENRCSDLLIVDTVVSVNNLTVDINLPNITSVETVRNHGQIVHETFSEDRCSITIDEHKGYQLVALKY